MFSFSVFFCIVCVPQLVVLAGYNKVNARLLTDKCKCRVPKNIVLLRIASIAPRQHDRKKWQKTATLLL